VLGSSGQSGQGVRDYVDWVGFRRGYSTYSGCRLCAATSGKARPSMLK